MALSGILQVHPLQPIFQLGPVRLSGLPAHENLPGHPWKSTGFNDWGAAHTATPESHQGLISGLLHAKGYKRVGVSAALNTGQSIVELCGSYVVLALVQSPSTGRLASLGAVSLASAILATILGAKPTPVAMF